MDLKMGITFSCFLTILGSFGLFLALFLTRTDLMVFGKTRPGPDYWVHPCHSSRVACDIACGLEQPLYWSCNYKTGYCLCPAKAKPGENCRPALYPPEVESCNVTTCNKFKKVNPFDKDGNEILPGQNMKASSFICESSKDGKLYCACFIVMRRSKILVIGTTKEPDTF